jgi:hypothetical protein
MMTVLVERSAVADAEAMVVVAQIVDWMALRARKLSDFIQGHACLNRPLKSYSVCIIVRVFTIRRRRACRQGPTCRSLISEASK